jgi:hypothetical protein
MLLSVVVVTEASGITSEIMTLALKATVLIGDLLTLTGTSDSIRAGILSNILSSDSIQKRARALLEQLPLEISTLLALKARAHLCASIGLSASAASGGDSRSERSPHAEQSRRDAAAALRLVPGDRDALHVHAASSERCGRLTDALESLAMLQRLSPRAKHGLPPTDHPAWNDFENRIAILERQRDEERRHHREFAARNTKTSSPFGKGYFDGSGSASEAQSAEEPQNTDHGERTRKTRPPTYPHHQSSSSGRSSGCSSSSGTSNAQAWRQMFAQQEEAWEVFCSQAGEAATIRSESSIPWPNEALTGFNFVGVDMSASRQQKKQAIKKMLLRWHPDKFAQKLSGRIKSLEVCESCQATALSVARRLNDLSGAL